MQVADGNKRRYFKDIYEDITRYGSVITYEGGMNYESTNNSKIEII